nr:HD domain-containing phosphohydrolase [Azomonas macrocytogenes]
MLPEALRHSQVVLIDDVIVNLRLLESSLRGFGLHAIKTFSDSRQGLAWLQDNPWDLLLLDLDMPSPNGFEVLQHLGKAGRPHSPVILVTAYTEAGDRRRGLELGANDYICKPFDLPELLLRVRNMLQLSHATRSLQHQRDDLEQKIQIRTQQLSESHQAVVRSLCRAARFKDNETGNHIVRIGESAALLASDLDQAPEWIENIRIAASMHDIGKIGIPDHILAKPSQLSPTERQIMNSHPQIGYDILNDYQHSPMLRMAAEIALHHHEKWDGSGYPQGLEGEQIPLAARIVALCDVYDALRSKRRYKTPWVAEKVQSFIREQAGRHFDPRLVEILIGRFDALEALQQRYLSDD